MAQIQDRKSNFYSQKHSIRDELSAPQYLESAGDELIKSLAKKQTNTCTSLQEQLEVVQNFEKGFQLNPENRKGISSLEDFKKHVRSEGGDFSSSTNRGEIRDLDELMKTTGLSRHELELSLCEKPSSKTSQLYMFAIGNRRVDKCETLESILPDHPINHLKEFEEECFSQNKKTKLEPTSNVEGKNGEKRGKGGKRKKPRKRRKKSGGNLAGDSTKIHPHTASTQEKNEDTPKASASRPSLWDVTDMKKWSESKNIGCKPQAFYTIKNGKIIKVEKESGREDTT